jgi:hypothetical protein
MGTIGKKLDELDADITAEVDRWAVRVKHASGELANGVGQLSELFSRAESRLGDDFGGFGEKARVHALRAGRVLDHAATEASLELERDERRVGAFFAGVLGKMREDLRPYGLELLRELDVIVSGAHSWIRTELSKRAAHPIAG